MAAVTLGKLKHWYCQVHTWRMLIGNVWVSRSYEYETRSAAGNYLVRPKGPIWVLLRRVVFSYNVGYSERYCWVFLGRRVGGLSLLIKDFAAFTFMSLGLDPLEYVKVKFCIIPLRWELYLLWNNLSLCYLRKQRYYVTVPDPFMDPSVSHCSFRSVKLSDFINFCLETLNCLL